MSSLCTNSPPKRDPGVSHRGGIDFISPLPEGRYRSASDWELIRSVRYYPGRALRWQVTSQSMAPALPGRAATGPVPQTLDRALPPTVGHGTMKDMFEKPCLGFHYTQPIPDDLPAPCLDRWPQGPTCLSAWAPSRWLH